MLFPPDLGEKLLLADRFARMQRQHAQQTELLACKTHAGTIERHPACINVDRQRTGENERRFADGRQRAPHARACPRQQLADPARLDHIVIGAEVQHAHLFGFVRFH